MFKKYKTFFRVDITVYQHGYTVISTRVELEKRENVWKNVFRVCIGLCKPGS